MFPQFYVNLADLSKNTMCFSIWRELKMKMNRQEYLDKVYGCWVGKNIGGTMGGPYEHENEMVDCKGFTSSKGDPLPNDDLDLQLVWLHAVEDYGIKGITPALLGEYWIEYINGPWNEYGIAKGNLRAGLLPPYSGEYDNDKWKNSNGAWIRTEIWACLFPGFPELAVRYAYKDACVDHGMGEGTYAAIFVAALESSAFVEKDIRKLIDGALSFIPEKSLVSKSVKKAISLYEKNTPFADARNAVVKETKELGMFQSPANVSFAILGLLYGEGDFKKTMIHTINCGDDADCTAATVGALMGIMHGKNQLPPDWVEYIGDTIKTIAIDSALWYTYPATCTELTQRVSELMPSTLKSYGIYCEYTDKETEREKFIDKTNEEHWGFVPDFEMPSTGLSIDFKDLYYARGRVEFDCCEVASNEEINFTFTFRNITRDTKHLTVKLFLPDGWTSEHENLHLCLHPMSDGGKRSTVSTKVTAGEIVSGKNLIYALVSADCRPSSSMIPIVIWGK